jgi:hypothetical protein
MTPFCNWNINIRSPAMCNLKLITAFGQRRTKGLKIKNGKSRWQFDVNSLL